MASYRTAAANEYRKLYKRPRWQALRKAVLLRDGFRCQWIGCGKILTGNHRQHNGPVVHHKKDHKGDLRLFYDLDNLMAICKECHDRDAQKAGHREYIAGHGEDGRPLDPDHPWNRGKT